MVVEDNSCSCSICQEPIDVPSFSTEESARGLHKDVFRLSCGHAFHVACIVESLRFSSNCPTCRAGGGGSGESSGAEVRITLHRNRLMITDVTDLSSEASDDWGGAGAGAVDQALLAQEQWEANPLVKQIRCSHMQTIVARRNLNDTISKYNRWRDEIRNARRRGIAAAITQLRRTRYREFQMHRAAVGLALRQLARTERSEVERRIRDRGGLGSELLRITPYNWGAQDLMRVDWQTTTENTRKTDPCERGFWSV